MENEKTFPCSHCRRLLPASEFYINHRTQQRDRYCKSCRQGINRRNRKRASIKRTDKFPQKEAHDIFKEEDKVRRLCLILGAKCVVRERIRRKRRKQAEDEFNSEDEL